MAARFSFRGFVKLSLVSVPVKAYSASTGESSQISFHQLHSECHSRIRYQKTCPIHGEVPSDQIVKGYEYAKDEYVVVDPEELSQLRPEGDRSISIEAFLRPEVIDPIYFAGKNYYLTPDGAAGQKPFVLLREAMEEEGLVCVALVVLSGREELMLVRPVEKLLEMNALEYQSQVRSPAAFTEEVPEVSYSSKEMELTKALVEATTTAEFDIRQYRDRYTEKLRELIEAKVSGREIVAAPAETPLPVINLMEALRKSVAQVTGAKSKASSPSSQRRSAPSSRQRRAPRKRKTG